jgi:fucose permease
MPGSQALILTAVCATLTVGMLLVLPTALRVPLARQLGRAETGAPGLRRVFFLAMIPALLLGGLLVDRLGIQEGLIIGSLATAVGLASLGRSWGYRAALGAAALVGTGLGLTHTATAALLPAAFDTPDRPTTATNLGYLFVGLSSLLLAGVLPVLERKLGLRQALLVLGLVCLAPAAAAGFAPKDAFPAPAPTGATGSILGDPRLWLAGLVLFLYQPLETIVTTWAPAYLAEVGRTPRAIPLVLVGFWIAFLGSRFLMALAWPELVPWLVLVLMILAAATVGNLSGMFHAGGGTVGLWLLGACLGPIFPSLIGLVFTARPHHPGPAFGLVVAVGSSSSLVLQPLVEHFARGHSVRMTMRLVMLVALVLAAPTLVLCLVIPQ